MTALAICQTPFPALKDSDTVGDAARRMLENSVWDLPVVDASGRLIGMFKLTHLLGTLLPKAATIGGMADLAFVGDTLDYLRDRMRAVEDKPIRAYIAEADHVVHPETSPMEVTLLLYRGDRAVPVVDPADNKLIGMVVARDVVGALLAKGAR